MEYTDQALIEKAMEIKQWNQSDVARYLDIGRAKITKVLRYNESLHPSSRKLLRILLEEEVKK